MGREMWKQRTNKHVTDARLENDGTVLGSAPFCFEPTRLTSVNHSAQISAGLNLSSLILSNFLFSLTITTL